MFIFIVLVFVACANSLQYIKDSSSFSSFELDYHDIESVIDKNASSFIKSNPMKKYNADNKAIIAISDIENLSDEKIDTEFISRKFICKLSAYEQIVLTNAVVGSGARTDKMTEDSRKLTKNENLNQYTTKEKGGILAPEYSLSGKITKNIKNIGKRQRVDYQFLFIVSDLDSGREVWSNDTIISKAIKKEEISKYSTTETNSIEANKYNEIGWSNCYNNEYGKAKKYFKKACKLGLKEACENARKAEDSKKEAKFTKSFSNNTNSIFGGILAVDLGVISSGRVNMPRTPYTYKSTDYSSSGKDVTMNIYLDKTDTWSFPTTLRVGGFYEQDEGGLYLETNFLYRIYKNNFDTYELECSQEGQTYCFISDGNIQNVSFKHSQIGGNLRIGYGGDISELGSLIVYAGGGVFMDIDSNMTIRGNYNLIKNIDNLYPFWEIGGYMRYGIFFVEMNYRYVFEGNIDKYWINAPSFNLSIGVFLSNKMFR